MADIAKCTGVDCLLKESCYRYTAPSSDYQSWQSFHYNASTNQCDGYWFRGESPQQIKQKFKRETRRY